MHAIDYELEVCLNRIEACQVGSNGFGAVISLPLSCSIEHSYLVRVAHEVPFQVFGHRGHTVVTSTELTVIVRLVLVISKGRSIPFLLFRPPFTSVGILFL